MQTVSLTGYGARLLIKRFLTSLSAYFALFGVALGRGASLFRDSDPVISGEPLAQTEAGPPVRVGPRPWHGPRLTGADARAVDQRLIFFCLCSTHAFPQ